MIIWILCAVATALWGALRFQEQNPDVHPDYHVAMFLCGAIVCIFVWPFVAVWFLVLATTKK